MIWNCCSFKEIQLFKVVAGPPSSSSSGEWHTPINKQCMSSNAHLPCPNSLLWCWKHPIYFNNTISFGFLIFCHGKEKFTTNYKSSHKQTDARPSQLLTRYTAVRVNRQFACSGSVSPWTVTVDEAALVWVSSVFLDTVSTPRPGLRVSTPSLPHTHTNFYHVLFLLSTEYSKKQIKVPSSVCLWKYTDVTICDPAKDTGAVVSLRLSFTGSDNLCKYKGLSL